MKNKEKTIKIVEDSRSEIINEVKNGIDGMLIHPDLAIHKCIEMISKFAIIKVLSGKDGIRLVDGEENRYPDIPIITDLFNNKIAIDVKSSNSTSGKGLSGNDAFSFINFESSRYNVFVEEFIIGVVYEVINNKLYTKNVIFDKLHFLLAKRKKDGFMSHGGDKFNSRMLSINRYNNGDYDYLSREELLVGCKETYNFLLENPKFFNLVNDFKIKRPKKNSNTYDPVGDYTKLLLEKLEMI